MTLLKLMKPSRIFTEKANCYSVYEISLEEGAQA